MRPSVSLLLLLLPAIASAEPYRIRADALALAQAPSGLLLVESEANPLQAIGAEAVVWTGTESPNGDVLVALLRARDPDGRGELRAGRMILSTGAVRPVQIDGLWARGRTPWGGNLEVFGGAPVVPAFGERSFDWLLGTRASFVRDELGTVGVSIFEQRDRGRLAHEEAGLDAAASPVHWLDLTSTLAYDLLTPGIVEARAAAAARWAPLRIEAFAARRSPGRLLPATSIFAALGDVPSDRVGLDGQVQVAPRLDMGATGSVLVIDDTLGALLEARAVLRLDDRGAGALRGELHWSHAAATGWTGLRVALRLPLVERLTESCEVEIVLPQQDAFRQGRDRVWPWALVSLDYALAPRWEAAAAIELDASPEKTTEVDALARLTWRWERR
jgi:hypothetical protein